MAKTYAFTYKKHVTLVNDFFQQFEEEHDAILEKIQYLRFQEEQGEGDDEGRTHLQGIIQFKNQQRLSGAQKFFVEECLLPKPNYLEQAKIEQALDQYTKKNETRVANGYEYQYGTFHKGGAPKRKVDDEDSFKAKRAKVFEWLVDGNDPDMAYNEFGDVILGMNMTKLQNQARIQRQALRKIAINAKANRWWEKGAYQWQRDLKTLMETGYALEDDRKVIVVLDRKGGAGKTKFGQRMVEINPTTTAYIKKSKGDNMAYLIKNIPDLQHVIVDYTRDDEKHGSPKFIESLKDGTIQSNKYEPTQVSFENIQVCVMTNNPLDWTTLSEDRWEIYEIDHSYVINGGEPEMHKWSDEQFQDSLADAVEGKMADKNTKQN